MTYQGFLYYLMFDISLVVKNKEKLIKCISGKNNKQTKKTLDMLGDDVLQFDNLECCQVLLDYPD